VKNAYLYKKERDMKKEAKVEYGIRIVKPWSKEMYDHNDRVIDVVTGKIETMWAEAWNRAEKAFNVEDDEFPDNEFRDMEWLDVATPELIRIQRAITCYGYGSGYTVAEVGSRLEVELDNCPAYRLAEMVEELDIKLEKGFVGFN
jgi:hypothetical protein